MKRPRVLIVDDSFVIRKMIERLLQHAGLDVGEIVQAASGAEGLAFVREDTFDLILLDIDMPVMDGLEFLRRLGTMDCAKGTPVVMLTTEDNEFRAVEALSIGATGQVRKPFTPDQIKECIFPFLEVMR